MLNNFEWHLHSEDEQDDEGHWWEKKKIWYSEGLRSIQTKQLWPMHPNRGSECVPILSVVVRDCLMRNTSHSQSAGNI